MNSPPPIPQADPQSPTPPCSLIAIRFVAEAQPPSPYITSGPSSPKGVPYYTTRRVYPIWFFWVSKSWNERKTCVPHISLLPPALKRGEPGVWTKHFRRRVARLPTFFFFSWVGRATTMPELQHWSVLRGQHPFSSLSTGRLTFFLLLLLLDHILQPGRSAQIGGERKRDCAL